MRICAITNVFNEAFNLPIWLGYYGGQIGIENCIVLDHASNDGSTDNLFGAGIIKLPPSPFDDIQRANIVSDVANAMLRTYDCVIYSDCDEIVVADPRRFSSLTAFCEQMRAPCSVGVGLNLIHHIGFETPIRPREKLLKQRSYVQFVSPMCKPLLVKERVSWGGGFHSSDLRFDFCGLFIFHLRWVDLGECLRRLAITRDVTFKNPNNGIHQRLPAADYLNRFLEFSRMPVEKESDFLFTEFTDVIMAEEAMLSNGKFGFGRDLRSKELHVVPDSFRNIF